MLLHVKYSGAGWPRGCWAGRVRLQAAKPENMRGNMAPIYGYCCRKCEADFDIMHGISEKPSVSCPKCNSKNTFKVISAPTIIVHNTSAVRRRTDDGKREAEIRADLKHNHGIERITPLQRGATLKDIYSEVKKQGSFNRDKMQRQREIDAATQKAKRKEWRREANKRAGSKYRIIQEQRAKEASAKRKIVI